MSIKEKAYPADRPLRAWARDLDGLGEPKRDVAFASEQSWGDETSNWFNISFIDVDGRTSIESARLLSEGTSEDDLMANGYSQMTLSEMLNFVETLAGLALDAEAHAYDTRIELDKVRHALGDEKVEVAHLKLAISGIFEDIFKEFCWTREYVDGTGAKRKAVFVPATEIDARQAVDQSRGEPVSWDPHEFRRDSADTLWRLDKVRPVERLSLDDLEAAGASPAPLEDWLESTFHTAKDLEAANLEISSLKSTIAALRGSRPGAAKDLVESTIGSFCWVTEWNSSDNSTFYRTVHIPRTNHEAELIALGHKDRPISWIRVASKSRSVPAAAWEITDFGQVDALTADALEGAGYEAKSLADFRLYARQWAASGAALRAKAEHPATLGEVERLRDKVSDLEKALEDERKANSDRIDGIVMSAHQWAAENDLDEAFDNFMIANGLPPRKRSWSVSLQVPLRITVPVEDCATDDEAVARASDLILSSVTDSGLQLDVDIVRVAGKPEVKAVDLAN